MIELTLIRHADTQWEGPDGHVVHDPGLSPLGRDQAERVAAAATATAGSSDLVLWSSPALRARETMAPIAEMLDLEVQVLPWLRELEFPDGWTDHPTADFHDQFTTWNGRPLHEWWKGIPGGEPFTAFRERVGTGMDRSLGALGVNWQHAERWHVSTEQECRVLMVGHAGSCAMALSHLLGMEPTPWEHERFPKPVASISRVGARELGGTLVFSLHQFASTTHLTRDSDFKRLVRQRQQQTGESYATARATLRPQSGPAFDRVIPVLRIFDEGKAREFYVGYLGMTVDFEHRFEPDLPLYLQVSRGQLVLHLSEHHGDGTPGTTVHVATSQVRELHGELTAKNTAKARPGLVEDEIGTHFEVIDPFGNTLRFNERP